MPFLFSHRLDWLAMQNTFVVIHKSGQRLWAYDETENGFLHLVPLYPSIGITGPPAYILKKPFWRRMNIYVSVAGDRE